MNIQEKVLSLICCPVCSNSFAHDEGGFYCASCEKVYLVEDGIIILLPEKAITKSDKNEK